MSTKNTDYSVIYADDDIVFLNKRSGLLIAADRYDSDAPLDDRLTGEKKYSLGTITRGTNAEAFTAWLSAEGYELDKSTFNYAAGYYNFVVDFYTNNPSHIKIGTYSDIILIEPNRVTAPSLITLKKILYTKPDVPTNVKLWRDDSSMTQEFYNVIITWDDNSDNEEYYSIKVCEYADGSDFVSHSFYIDNKKCHFIY